MESASGRARRHAVTYCVKMSSPVHRPCRSRPSRLRRFIALCVVGVGFALARPALAQPSADQKETARNLMDIGDAKAEAGDLKAALEAYRGANDIMHVPTTGLALGKVLEKLGLLAEARETLLDVARHPTSPGESPVFAEARAEASSLAAAIAPRIPTLTVAVKGAPSGVEVALSIDGQLVPAAATSLPQKLSPGHHVVRATAHGFRKAETAIDLAERETRSLELTLVASDDDTAPDEHGSSTHWLTWVGVGVGSAGLLAGAVAGPIALKKTADLRADDCVGDVCGTDDKTKVDAARSLANAATGGFIVGGVGVVLALVGALALSGGDEPAAEPAAARVLPVVGPGYFGLEGVF